MAEARARREQLQRARRGIDPEDLHAFAQGRGDHPTGAALLRGGRAVPDGDYQIGLPDQYVADSGVALRAPVMFVLVLRFGEVRRSVRQYESRRRLARHLPHNGRCRVVFECCGVPVDVEGNDDFIALVQQPRRRQPLEFLNRELIGTRRQRADEGQFAFRVAIEVV